MDKEMKEGIKRLADGAQKSLARAILSWKYRKAGVPLPHEEDLEAQSQKVVEGAQEVIVARGKNIIDEFKKVYGQHGPKDEGERNQ